MPVVIHRTVSIILIDFTITYKNARNDIKQNDIKQNLNTHIHTHAHVHTHTHRRTRAHTHNSWGQLSLVRILKGGKNLLMLGMGMPIDYGTNYVC